MWFSPSGTSIKDNPAVPVCDRLPIKLERGCSAPFSPLPQTELSSADHHCVMRQHTRAGQQHCGARCQAFVEMSQKGRRHLQRGGNTGIEHLPILAILWYCHVKAGLSRNAAVWVAWLVCAIACALIHLPTP